MAHDEHQQSAVELMRQLHRQEKGLTKRIKKLLKDHPSSSRKILTHDIHGWSFLHASVLRGSRELVKAIVESDVDVNHKMGSPEGLPGNCSLLHLAAYRGDAKIIKMLISRGAQVNERDTSNDTPLLYALRNSHKEAVKTLIEAGAEMDRNDLQNVDSQKHPATNKLLRIGILSCVSKR